MAFAVDHLHAPREPRPPRAPSPAPAASRNGVKMPDSSSQNTKSDATSARASSARGRLMVLMSAEECPIGAVQSRTACELRLVCGPCVFAAACARPALALYGVRLGGSRGRASAARGTVASDSRSSISLSVNQLHNPMIATTNGSARRKMNWRSSAANHCAQASRSSNSLSMRHHSGGAGRRLGGRARTYFYYVRHPVSARRRGVRALLRRARLGELHRPGRPVQYHAMESAGGARRLSGCCSAACTTRPAVLATIVASRRRGAARAGRLCSHDRSRRSFSPPATAVSPTRCAGCCTAMSAAITAAASRSSWRRSLAGHRVRRRRLHRRAARPRRLSRLLDCERLAALLDRRRGRESSSPRRFCSRPPTRHAVPGCSHSRAAARRWCRRSSLLATIWLIFEVLPGDPGAPLLPAVRAAHLDRGSRRHERRRSSRPRSCSSASCSAIHRERRRRAAGGRIAGAGRGADADRALPRHDGGRAPARRARTCASRCGSPRPARWPAPSRTR